MHTLRLKPRKCQRVAKKLLECPKKVRKQAREVVYE